MGSSSSAARPCSSYYRDEEATRAVLDSDGWLHTGDIARIDEDGSRRSPTGRKTSSSPPAGRMSRRRIENELKGSKYVSQALVVGDRRPYVAALITLDEPEVAKWREDGDEEAPGPDPGCRRRRQRPALAPSRSSGSRSSARLLR
jgi:long-subunit acyl-CoA synthetase (AMP-forming)